MAPSVDQTLQDWASHATDDELDAGPSLADLGGTEAVLAEAGQLAAGPLLPYLLTALGRELNAMDSDQARQLLDAAAQGLRDPQAAWVLADAIDVVCAHPDLAMRLGNRTVRDLAAHVETALAGDADAALAQPAVAGLLRLAVAQTATPHRLLGLLTEITGNEPSDALERLPILVGVAHDHFGDDALLDVLSALENQASLPSGTRADASFELALADMRTALEAPDRAAVEEHLRRALMRFKDLDRTHETRLDARAHAAAVDAVLAFGELDPRPAAATPAEQRLAEAAAQLDTVIAQLAAWTRGMHQLDWLSARGLTQSAWSRLVTSLQTARTHLDQPSWYDPASALGDLLDVYVASRSIHTAPAGESNGLTALVSPPVEAAFVRSDGLLHHLEQALTTDPQFTNSPDALALREAVRAQRQATATGQVVPGKTLEGRPTLAALFQTDTPALRKDLDPQLLDRIEQLVEQHAKGYTPTGNARLDAHLELLLEELATSPAWKPRDSSYFTTLLEQFLRFLYDRFDAQADYYGVRTAYLGPCPDKADGTPDHWDEKHVQDDLHQHLAGTLTPGTVQRELIDVASGRTDVTYTPEPGSRFVAEVKRRTTNWTRERIQKGYLAQAANYTATGPPFGILLVGDDSGHTGGYRSVEDSIWIIHHARSATEVPRLIVTGVLPIGRPTPSALRLPRTTT
ncbi:hypothetical protein [Actinacidiphila acidipaludis]|uniref:Uncharacterized protein n=1 Tax=Actinacidiphila acidipaludis TaxID=2873382 RepID=A0ABS7QKG9_9ACTN|nr:hypothetical protein [Streptomyces acidipaludis]MBY8882900.1 hypothetical protein [Streptomyces acidipaludis]